MRRPKASGGLAECHRCGRPIRFVLLDTGSAMPVDPLVDLRGNVAAVTGSGARLYGHVTSAAKPARAGYRLYVPHFATCPERQPADPKPEPPPTLFDQPEE